MFHLCFATVIHYCTTTSTGTLLLLVQFNVLYRTVVLYVLTLGLDQYVCIVPVPNVDQSRVCFGSDAHCTDRESQ